MGYGTEGVIEWCKDCCFQLKHYSFSWGDAQKQMCAVRRWEMDPFTGLAV